MLLEKLKGRFIKKVQLAKSNGNSQQQFDICREYLRNHDSKDSDFLIYSSDILCRSIRFKEVEIKGKKGGETKKFFLDLKSKSYPDNLDKLKYSRDQLATVSEEHQEFAQEYIDCLDLIIADHSPRTGNQIKLFENYPHRSKVIIRLAHLYDSIGNITKASECAKEALEHLFEDNELSDYEQYVGENLSVIVAKGLKEKLDDLVNKGNIEGFIIQDPRFYRVNLYLAMDLADFSLKNENLESIGILEIVKVLEYSRKQSKELISFLEEKPRKNQELNEFLVNQAEFDHEIISRTLHEIYKKTINSKNVPRRTRLMFCLNLYDKDKDDPELNLYLARHYFVEEDYGTSFTFFRKFRSIFRENKSSIMKLPYFKESDYLAFKFCAYKCGEEPSDIEFTKESENNNLSKIIDKLYDISKEGIKPYIKSAENDTETIVASIFGYNIFAVSSDNLLFNTIKKEINEVFKNYNGEK